MLVDVGMILLELICLGVCLSAFYAEQKHVIDYHEAIIDYSTYETISMKKITIIIDYAHVIIDYVSTFSVTLFSHCFSSNFCSRNLIEFLDGVGKLIKRAKYIRIL